MRNVIHVSENTVFAMTNCFTEENLFVVNCKDRLDGKMAFRPKTIKKIGHICKWCDLNKFRNLLDPKEINRLCPSCQRADARNFSKQKNPQSFRLVREW